VNNLLNSGNRRSKFCLLTWSFTGLLVASLLGACGAQGPTSPDPTPTPDETTTQIRINELFGASSERRLEVGVASCDDDPEVKAVETADEVQLTATIFGERSGLECQDSVQVILKKPLGDRQVRDTMTGKLLELGALEQDG
jgi:hypothetical protein